MASCTADLERAAATVAKCIYVLYPCPADEANTTAAFVAKRRAPARLHACILAHP